MSSSIAAAARKTPPARTQGRGSRRRLIWVGSGVLVLVLVALLVLAFSLGADEPAPQATVQANAASSALAHPADAVLPKATSDEIVVDRPPGPPPRMINGIAVDADGNSIDPNLTRPADDADEAKDDSADTKTTN